MDGFFTIFKKAVSELICTRLYIIVYSIFCRASPFHCEWSQLVTILKSFDLPFEKKFKSLKYQLKQAIHGECMYVCNYYISLTTEYIKLSIYEKYYGLAASFPTEKVHRFRHLRESHHVLVA